MPEVREAEAKTDGGVGAEAVRRFEGDQAPARADEEGAGPEELVERAVEGVGTSQPFGEVVEGGEVGEPGGQPFVNGGRLSGGRSFWG
ncbi:hypothetical protein [Streptomyces sp. CA-132043]|uniref:hypothetical protein n=1 Tax=Streptomyces sp. CA-132043 TaxID=3240048 RepID=UPI003D936C53